MKNELNNQKICIYYPANSDEHCAVVEDIADVFRRHNHEACCLAPDAESLEDVLQKLDKSDWVIILFSADEKRQLSKNKAISKALREKIHSDSVFTIKLTTTDYHSVPITLAHVQWLDLSELSEQYPKNVNEPAEIRQWRAYLEKKCTVLLERMDVGKTYNAEVEFLKEYLQPSNYTAEIARREKSFVGRDWLLDDVSECWKLEKEESIFLLQAPLGAGISSLCAKLAATEPCVVGIQFCDLIIRENQTDPLHQLIRTLAFQLACRDSAYREDLARKFKSNPKFSISNLMEMPSSQLAREIIFNSFNPLYRMAEETQENLLVIIDGIDTFSRHYQKAPHSKNYAVEAFLSDLAKVTNSVRVLVTSVTNRDLSLAFQSRERQANPLQIYLSSPQNLADVEIVLQEGLAPHFETETELNRAVLIGLNKAGGSMLYASAYIRAVASKEINGLETTHTLLAELHQRYLVFMNNLIDISLWEDESRGISLKKFTRALALRLDDWTKEELKEHLQLPSNKFSNKLDKLGPLIFEQTTPAGATQLRFFHESFKQWLLKPEQPHPYQLT